MLLLPAQMSPDEANIVCKCSPVAEGDVSPADSCAVILSSHFSLGSNFYCSKANYCLMWYGPTLLAACRYNYVTPTSYLELLTTFTKLLAEKRREIDVSRRRLETGLDKLLSTAAQVEVMQVRG